MNTVDQDINDCKFNKKNFNGELAFNNVLDSLSNALLEGSNTIQEITGVVLEHARGITSSEHGYVSVIDPDTKDNIAYKYTKMFDYCSRGKDKDKKLIFSKGSDGLYTRFLGHSLNSQIGFFTNEPLSHELYDHQPELNIAMKSFLSVPVMMGKELHGQITLANSHNVYTEDSIKAVKIIGKVYALAINAHRKEEMILKLEKQLLHATKLSSIGALASGIAHDFNNVLTAIIGYAELIEMFQIPPQSPMCTNIQEIINAGYRARELVDQILAYSQDNDNKRKIFEMSFILKETLKFIRSILPNSIIIDISINSDKSTVFANLTQIHQIIMILFTRAADMLKGRKGLLSVNLELKRIVPQDSKKLDHLSPGLYVCLNIADTGVGFDRQIINLMFDPFLTAKSKLSKLGLELVYEILKDHGGTFIVSSEVGVGSEFTVYIPYYARKQYNLKHRKRRKISRGNASILFVDDEISIVNYYKNLLKNLGYKFVGCTCSVEALELFRESPEKFDLVITDQVMPYMTGLELSRKMMMIRSDIPIILLTGYKLSETSNQAKHMGIKKHLLKPIGADKFTDSIKKVLK